MKKHANKDCPLENTVENECELCRQNIPCSEGFYSYKGQCEKCVCVKQGIINPKLEICNSKG